MLSETGLPLFVAYENRVFTFTNKKSAFFMGRTHVVCREDNFGWNVNGKRAVLDYIIHLNGKPLDRQGTKVILHPHKLERIYPNKVKETFAITESMECFWVELDISGFPALWIEIIGAEQSAKVTMGTEEITFLSAGKEVIAAKMERVSTGFCLYVGLGDSQNSATEKMRDLMQNHSLITGKQEARIDRFLNVCQIQCHDTNLDTELKWSKLSLDSLVVNNDKTELWAGLPWFNQQWGRDTFISLTGTLVINGQFNLAKDIFKTFAKKQITDINSPQAGRIPNRMSPGDPIYNTADAAFWYIHALHKYLLYSGDTEFCTEMFHIVRTAIEGAEKHCLDGNSFVMHGDAETWMDAVGPKGPYSPRGNRAVEIQALWYCALLSGAAMAEMASSHDLAEKWKKLAETVKINFRKNFIDTINPRIFDCIRADGSKDDRIRPNAIFAITLPDAIGLPPLIEDAEAAAILQGMVSNLVTKKGVLSLAPQNADFHPYHDYEKYTHKDEAYHNGIIWPWLTGPFIQAMSKLGQASLAADLFKELSKQVLELDPIGSICELLEAAPRPGATGLRVSGAMAQTWSMAEYQRAFAEDFVGYSPDAPSNTFSVSPCVALGKITVRLPFRNLFIITHIAPLEDAVDISVSCPGLKDEIKGLIQTISPIAFELNPTVKTFQTKISYANIRSYNRPKWELAKVNV